MLSLIKAMIASPYLALAAICLAVLSFVAQLIVTERYKDFIAREHDRFIEELRWDSKIREQAAKAAEYMALQINLREDSPQSEYDRANMLGWELAMWLPTDVYRKLCRAAVSATPKERFEVVLEVRKVLLKEKAGDLTWNDIIFHAPGIGRNRNSSSPNK